jgi:hypothetical protein
VSHRPSVLPDRADLLIDIEPTLHEPIEAFLKCFQDQAPTIMSSGIRSRLTQALNLSSSDTAILNEILEESVHQVIQNVSATHNVAISEIPSGPFAVTASSAEIGQEHGGHSQDETDARPSEILRDLTQVPELRHDDVATTYYSDNNTNLNVIGDFGSYSLAGVDDLGDLWGHGPEAPQFWDRVYA